MSRELLYRVAMVVLILCIWLGIAVVYVAAGGH